jgi:hypothetical protein
MPRTINRLEAVATIGIDIARTRSTSSVSTGMARSFCARSFHAAKSRLGSRTCRPASSVWSRALGRIT